MINMVIVGYGNEFERLTNVLINSQFFKITSIANDANIENDDYLKFAKNISADIITLDDIVEVNPDIFFVITCKKKIPNYIYNNFCSINLHGGFLPKWRGINSNLWAILNGENEIGYTLHHINEVYDAGDIIKKYAVKVDVSNPYIAMKNKILNKVELSIAEDIKLAYEGKINLESQNNSKYIYTTPLKPVDGCIVSWNVESKYLIRLFSVMGYPHGTGVYFIYKGNRTDIIEIGLDEMFLPYLGIPGGVCFINEKGHVYIKVSDTAIVLKKIMINNECIAPSELLKIGMRL